MTEQGYWTKVLRKRVSRRWLLRSAIVSGAGLAVAGVVGCGDGEEAPPGATPTPGAATPTPGVATPTPATATPAARRAGGKLVYAENFNPSLLDPHLTLNTPAKDMNDLVYESLVTFRGGEDKAKWVLEPQLVEAMPERPDDLTYVFKLRPNLAWHDIAPANGRAVTAEDVKFSFERMATVTGGTTGAGSPYRSIMEAIDKSEVIDARTLRVTLSRPFPGFLPQIGQSEVAIVNPETVSQVGEQEKEPFVGTGPFMRTRWEPNVVAEHKRSPKYFLGSEYPLLDEFDFAIIPEEATRLAQLRSGAVDLIVGGVETRDNALGSVEDVVALAAPGTEPAGVVTLSVFLNPDYPPTSDPLVRQALAYAIDYDAFISGLAQGEAIRCGFMKPDSWAELGALQADELPSFDLQKAKQLMEAAGYADGFDITTVGSLARKHWGDGTLILKEMWGKIGVRVTPDPSEHTVFIKKITDHASFQSSIQGEFSDGPDPHFFLFNEFHTGGSIALHASDSEVDEALDRLGTTEGTDAQKALLVDIQELLLEKMFKIPIMLADGFVLYRSTIKGPEDQKLLPVRFGVFQAWNWSKEA